MSFHQYKIATAFGLCVFPLFSIAGMQGVDSDQLQQLSSDPKWHNLMHYEPVFLKKNMESAIHSPEFFLHEEGKTNPKAELIETIRGLQDQRHITDESVRCLFPARTLWLTQQLGTHIIPPSSQPCVAFEEWTKGKSYDSVSMVFATGYLENPASYYGHTLLKINYGKDSKDRLQDVTLNFGAIIEGASDPLSYIVKGIFGGYDGAFSEVDYYVQRSVYGESEDRDLWEYKLNLSDDEVDMVVAHAWEVINKRYTYYFFGKNCAYRTSEMIDLLTGIKTNPDSSPWTIPQSNIQAIGNSLSTNNGPLLEEVVRDRSITSRYHNKIKELDRSEMQVFRKLGSGEVDFRDHEYQVLSTSSKGKVIDALIDYTDIRLDDDKDITRLHRRVLNERLSLPPIKDSHDSFDKDTPPHLGKPPSLVQFGYDHSGYGSRGVIRLRPAYYDPLDVRPSIERVDGLSMGDISISFDGSEVNLKNLDLIRIDSMKSGYSWLPGDRPSVWSLSAGIKPISLKCDSCLTPKIEASKGVGKHFGSVFYGSISIGGALQHDKHHHGNAYGALISRLIYKPTAKAGFMLDIERRNTVGGQVGDYTTLKIQGRYSVSKNLDLRATYEDDLEDQFSLSIGYHW